MVESSLVQETLNNASDVQERKPAGGAFSTYVLPYAAMLPYYRKWIGTAFPNTSQRSLIKKSSTFSAMMITSKYLSPDHPYGFLDSKEKKQIAKEAGETKEKEQEKGKKDKKDKKDKKGKKGKKDKKDKKGKKDKKDKKDKDHDDKDEKKDKEDKKDKKDSKDKKEKDEKLTSEQKAEQKEAKRNQDPTYRANTIRSYLRNRDENSLSTFAPLMSFVKCPSGSEGEECHALKRAAHASLTADRCWYNYMTKLDKCGGKKDCLKGLSTLEESCFHQLTIAKNQANQVLKSENSSNSDHSSSSYHDVVEAAKRIPDRLMLSSSQE